MADFRESPYVNLVALSVELERAVHWMDIEPRQRRFSFAWDGQEMTCTVWSLHADGRTRYPGATTATGTWCFAKAMRERERARVEGLRLA